MAAAYWVPACAGMTILAERELSLAWARCLESNGVASNRTVSPQRSECYSFSLANERDGALSDFEERYAEKLTTADELVSRFRSGQFIQLGVWSGEPYGTIAAMSGISHDIDPLFVGVSIATSEAAFMESHPQIRCMTGFIGPRERAALALNDNVYYTPTQFTDGQRRTRIGVEMDYFIYRVGAMDERGMFNFSLTASWEYDAIKYCKAHRPKTTIVFEVNKNLPRVFGLEEHGNNELSLDYCDVIVEDDAPMLDYPVPAAGATELGIARNVAELVEDRATVQLGFGTLPMAIGTLLCDRRELGIHTEMFCEAHIDLWEAGAVTNAHKGYYDGVSVATFALGTTRLHEWMRENRDVALLPVEEVNGIEKIARVNKMASVNSVLMVDATGQTCAHCIGPRTYSGLGGAFEFACGSQLSPGGQSISCLPSTTTLKDGRVISNIMAQFEKGTRVTVPEHVVDWVVTEYGAVRLKVLPVEQRAAALVDIAHPDFREQLSRDIMDAGIRLDHAARLPKPPAHLFAKA